MPLSNVLSDVRVLKGIVISVLPDLMKRLEMIDSELQQNISDISTKVTVGTQTDIEEPVCSLEAEAHNFYTSPAEIPSCGYASIDELLTSMEPPQDGEQRPVHVKMESCEDEPDAGVSAISMLETSVNGFSTSPILLERHCFDSAESSTFEQADNSSRNHLANTTSPSIANGVVLPVQIASTSTGTGRILKCKLCSKVYSANESLVRHMVEVHQVVEHTTRKRRAVLFTPDMDENLIDRVKQHPVIWAMDMPCYKDTAKKAAAWISIADEFEMTVETVKKRWKGINNSYRLHKKVSVSMSNKTANKTVTGQAALGRPVKNNGLYESLSFVDAHRPSRWFEQVSAQQAANLATP